MSFKKKRAFITGITGQDGSYLADFLLKKKYEVFGMVRRSSTFSTKRIDHLIESNKIRFDYGDLTDTTCINNLLNDIKPNEIYNLGAQSHVKVSFELPDYTAQVDGLGSIKLLSAIKANLPKAKYYQASTSELFGGSKLSSPQNEKTFFDPKSPYAAAKLYSYWITRIYRDSYNIHASNGILFNHESPRRGYTFVTKKITKAVSDIKKGKIDCFKVGNLDAIRDWGYAKKYVETMWLMLQQTKPDDYVISSGKGYTVRQFIEKAFEKIGINIKWKGSSLNEVGYCSKTKKIHVKVDSKYFRPNEVDKLIGNSKKAQKKLRWKYKVSIDELINIMIKYDLKFDDYGGDLT